MTSMYQYIWFLDWGGVSRCFLVEREYPFRDVVEEPVDAAEEVLAGDGAAPHDAPVVRLDAVQLQHLEKCCKISLSF